MEIVILKRNDLNEIKEEQLDDFNIKNFNIIERPKFNNANVVEITISEIIKYAYPIISYIKYESIENLVTKNMVNVKKEVNEVPQLIAKDTFNYKTINDIYGYIISTSECGKSVNPKLFRVAIPKNTNIFINSFIFFNDYSKSQVFNNPHASSISNYSKIDTLLHADYSELIKINKVINSTIILQSGKDEFVITKDFNMLKLKITNSFDNHYERMRYVTDLYAFDNSDNSVVIHDKIRHEMDNKQTEEIRDETRHEMDNPRRIGDKQIEEQDNYYTKKPFDKMVEDHSFNNLSLFDLFIENKLEIYYHELLDETDEVAAELKKLDEMEKLQQIKNMNDAVFVKEKVKNIIKNTLSNKKFKKDFSKLNNKEKELIEIEYKIYIKKTGVVNKCDHIKILNRIRNGVSFEDELSLYQQLMKFADFKNKEETIVKCNVCHYDLICKHRIDIFHMRKKNMQENVIRNIIIKNYSDSLPLDEYYYCKICSESIGIVDMEQDVIFINNVKVQNDVMIESDVSSMIYIDSMQLLKNHINFSTLINTTHLSNNIVSALTDKLEEINNTIRKSKTTDDNYNFSILKIHSYTYIMALLLFIINSPSNKTMSLITKRTDKRSEISHPDKRAEGAGELQDNNAKSLLEFEALEQETDDFSHQDEINVEETDEETVGSSNQISHQDERSGGNTDTKKNIKELFENGFRILIDITDSYAKTCNYNSSDIKSILIEAFKFVSSNTVEIKENTIVDLMLFANPNYYLIYFVNNMFDKNIKITDIGKLIGVKLKDEKTKKKMTEFELYMKQVSELYKNGDNIFIDIRQPKQITDYINDTTVDNLQQSLNESYNKNEKVKDNKMLSNKMFALSYNLIKLYLEKQQQLLVNNPILEEKNYKELVKYENYAEFNKKIRNFSFYNNKHLENVYSYSFSETVSGYYLDENNKLVKRKYNKYLTVDDKLLTFKEFVKYKNDNQGKLLNELLVDLVSDDGMYYSEYDELPKISIYDLFSKVIKKKTNVKNDVLKSIDDNFSRENVKNKNDEKPKEKNESILDYQQENSDIRHESVEIKHETFNPQDVTNIFGIHYNVIINLGLTESFTYNDIVKNVINPSKDKKNSVMRYNRIHNYLNTVCIKYNMLKNNLVLSNIKNEDYFDVNLVVSEYVKSSPKHSAKDFEHLPDITKLINTAQFYNVDLSDDEMVNKQCNLILAHFWHLCVTIAETMSFNKKELKPFVLDFIIKVVKKIVKNDEMLSKANYYELIRKSSEYTDKRKEEENENKALMNSKEIEMNVDMAENSMNRNMFDAEISTENFGDTGPEEASKDDLKDMEKMELDDEGDPDAEDNDDYNFEADSDADASG
jgi:hypothetical protein